MKGLHSLYYPVSTFNMALLSRMLTVAHHMNGTYSMRERNMSEDPLGLPSRPSNPPCFLGAFVAGLQTLRMQAQGSNSSGLMS